METLVEQLEFQSGSQLWSWLINSNPICGILLDDLQLTEKQGVLVRRTLDEMVRARAGESERAVLTNPINIGIGTKVAVS